MLESVVFDPAKFLEELAAFDDLLKSKADLSEKDDIQPFFKKSKHLTAYMGTFALNIAVATEICFQCDRLDRVLRVQRAPRLRSIVACRQPRCAAFQFSSCK